jgi:hypothetical protein
MKTQSMLRSIPAVSGRKVAILGILILVISTGFVWMANEQAIASPILRTADLLWRLFVCRCFFQFDLLQ